MSTDDWQLVETKDVPVHIEQHLDAASHHVEAKDSPAHAHLARFPPGTPFYVVALSSGLVLDVETTVPPPGSPPAAATHQRRESRAGRLVGKLLGKGGAQQVQLSCLPRSSDRLNQRWFFDSSGYLMSAMASCEFTFGCSSGLSLMSDPADATDVHGFLAKHRLHLTLESYLRSTESK
jgi:hypothetical protein